MRAIWLFALCTACFHTTAPRGWLPTPEQAQTDAYGGWIRVEYQQGDGVEGELLAATTDTIHVLTAEGWKAAPSSNVKRATLTGYDLEIQPLVTWGILGTLATASHGFILILTAPIWIITSTVEAGAASRAPRIVSTSPTALNVFARFPQGLPPDINRATILPRRPAFR